MQVQPRNCSAIGHACQHLGAGGSGGGRGHLGLPGCQVPALSPPVWPPLLGFPLASLYCQGHEAWAVGGKRLRQRNNRFLRLLWGGGGRRAAAGSPIPPHRLRSFWFSQVLESRLPSQGCSLSGAGVRREPAIRPRSHRQGPSTLPCPSYHLSTVWEFPGQSSSLATGPFLFTLRVRISKNPFDSLIFRRIYIFLPEKFCTLRVVFTFFKGLNTTKKNSGRQLYVPHKGYIIYPLALYREVCPPRICVLQHPALVREASGCSVCQAGSWWDRGPRPPASAWVSLTPALSGQPPLTKSTGPPARSRLSVLPQKPSFSG